MKRRIFLVLGLALAASFGSPAARADDTSPTTTAAKIPDHLKKALANPPENPSLPNVLLIGDSISIGYTVPVRKLLEGKANVFLGKQVPRLQTLVKHEVDFRGQLSRRILFVRAYTLLVVDRRARPERNAGEAHDEPLRVAASPRRRSVG